MFVCLRWVQIEAPTYVPTYNRNTTNSTLAGYFYTLSTLLLLLSTVHASTHAYGRHDAHGFNELGRATLQESWATTVQGLHSVMKRLSGDID
jgi:hypothetical protein